MSNYINIEILSEEEEVRQVCERYWMIDLDGEFSESNTKQICADFELKNHALNKLLKESCKVFVPSVTCDRCSVACEVFSRTQYKELVKRRRYSYQRLCDQCVDKKRQESIERHVQEKLEAENRQKKASEILITINESVEPFILDELAFKEIVYLKTLYDHSASESLEEILPFKNNPGIRVAPHELSKDIILELKQNGIIQTSPNSEPGSFQLEEGGGITYDPSSVNFLVNFDKAEFNDSAFYKKLCDIVSHRLYSHEHLPYFITLSQEVMLQYCLEFLIMLIEEHNLTFSPGEKTETLFRELSESFSISEIMNFIYSAVKNAAAYYMKGNVSKKQAANSIVGSIQRRAENTIQENWEVKKFRRNYDLPQSTLERVLYSKVFKGDDKAFDLSLNRQVELLE